LIPLLAPSLTADAQKHLLLTGPSPHYSSPVNLPPRPRNPPFGDLAARTQQYTLGAP